MRTFVLYICKSGLNGISHGVPTRSDCRVPCLEHLCHFGANSRNWRPASLNLVLGCRNQQKGRESIKPHPQLLMANASRPSGPGGLNIENHSGHCAFSEEASRSTCVIPIHSHRQHTLLGCNLQSPSGGPSWTACTLLCVEHPEYVLTWPQQNAVS